MPPYSITYTTNVTVNGKVVAKKRTLTFAVTPPGVRPDGDLSMFGAFAASPDQASNSMLMGTVMGIKVITPI